MGDSVYYTMLIGINKTFVKERALPAGLKQNFKYRFIELSVIAHDSEMIVQKLQIVGLQPLWTSLRLSLSLRIYIYLRSQRNLLNVLLSLFFRSKNEQL